MLCLFYNRTTGLFDSCRESDEIISIDSAFSLVYGTKSNKVQEKLAGFLVDELPNFDGSKKVDINTQQIIDNPDYVPPPLVPVEPVG